MIGSASSPVSLHQLQARFLDLVPKLETHATILFRQIVCPDKRADLISEAIALGWKWYCRLHEMGKDVAEFPVVFASLVGKAVRSGRRLCGQERANDVLSPVAQRRHGFAVEGLPSSTATPHDRLYGEVDGQRELDVYEERLHDNTVTPPDQQAMFRVDFAAWLRTMTGRERRLIHSMSRNERTKDLSRQFQLSPGRISQFRREFAKDWKRYCGDQEENAVN
jgi:hypothetical protein